MKKPSEEKQGKDMTHKRQQFSIAELFYDLRKRLKLSRKNLAPLIDRHDGSIQYWEEKKSDPPTDVVRFMKMLTGWSYDYIIDRIKRQKNDGDYSLASDAVEVYKQNKDAKLFRDYVQYRSERNDNNIHTEGPDSPVFAPKMKGGGHIVGAMNYVKGSMTVGDITIESPLTEKERKAILELKEDNRELHHKVELLNMEVENCKKIIAAKNEIIDALKGK